MNLIIALVAGGFILLFAEIFLPGLVAGIIGVLCLLASVVVTASLYGTTLALGLFGALSLVGTAGFLIWMKFFPSSPFGRRLSLQETSGKSPSIDPSTDLTGQIGNTATALRPSGTALFHNKRHDVISEGSHIEANQTVKVVKVEGARIVVRKI
jgi:membrane-bound serine protease (ClpP class)